MLENEKMIKEMVMEHLLLRIKTNTLDSRKTINKMVRV